MPNHRFCESGPAFGKSHNLRALQCAQGQWVKGEVEGKGTLTYGDELTWLTGW